MDYMSVYPSYLIGMCSNNTEWKQQNIACNSNMIIKML